jgi:flagellar hook-associated protein 1 FlgK
MDITSFERANGEIAVVGRIDDATTGGTDEGDVRTLVDSKAAQFDFSAATSLGVGQAGQTPRLSTNGDVALNASAGGKLGALIEMRDSGLPDVHAEIDRLAATVRDRLNAAHNQGTFGNAGQASITGSTDLSADTLTGAAGSLTINEVDSAGQVTATHAISLGTVGSFADLEAALSVGNVDATITGGRMELSHTGGGRLTVDTGDATVTGDHGTKGLSHYLGLNDLFHTPNLPDPTGVTNAAGRLQVRSDLQADPSLLSRGSARATTGAAAIAAGDNSVAQQLAQSFEQSGVIAASGRLDDVDTTLSGYAGDVLGVHANAVARTERDLEFQKTLHSELEYRAQSDSGVNIDEELSNIVTFEQAYNASARVISTVQEMFDTLDRMLN